MLNKDGSASLALFSAPQALAAGGAGVALLLIAVIAAMVAFRYL